MRQNKFNIKRCHAWQASLLMKVIGITGGVGSGKSALLAFVKEKYHCRVILADEVAHQVKEVGQPCYEQLVRLLSQDILNEDLTINKNKMASKIFGSQTLLKKVNEIIHPAVKEYILTEIARARSEGDVDFVFLEAALLIEEGYLEIVDEMWYIYAGEEIRRKRLKEARGYSDEKIDAILQSQLQEEEFREHCHVVIDNSGSIESACGQIADRLGRNFAGPNGNF